MLSDITVALGGGLVIGLAIGAVVGLVQWFIALRLR
jgi:hypothetical protein